MTDHQISSLSSLLHQDLFEFLKGSISGGLLCGYTGEGFPFHFISDQLLHLLGFESREEYCTFIKNKLINGIHPDDREYTTDTVVSALNKDQTYEIKYRMLKKDGSFIWVIGQGKKFFHKNSEFVASICLDITDTIELQQELSELTQNIPGGVCKILMDQDFTLLYGNDSFYQLYGYTSAEMQTQLGNKLIATILPEDATSIMEIIERTYRSQESHFEFEQRIFHKDGSIRYLLTNGAFSHSRKGVPTLNCVIIDITKRRLSEQELAINEERFRIAVTQTQSVIFDYHIQKKQVVHSKETMHLYGLPEIMNDVPESFVRSKIIPRKHAAAFLSMYREIQQGSPHSSCTVEILAADGKYYWNTITMTTVFNGQHKLVRAIGVVENITQHKEMEYAYLKEETYRRALLADTLFYAEINLTEGIIDTLSEMNTQELMEHLCRSYDQYLRVEGIKNIHREDYPKFLETFSRKNLLANYANGIQELKLEYRHLTNFGKTCWVETTAHMMKDPVSGDIRCLLYLHDIDAAKRERLTLENASRLDPLTKLYNKGAAETLIRSQLEASSPDACHAFIIIDLDHFKKINDLHGHACGDKVLKETAKRIQQHFRSDDIIGRIGGDEFIAFIKNIPSKDFLIQKLEKLRYTVVPFRGILTYSMGICLTSNYGFDFEVLYEKADIALYHSKARGRNCFTFYTSVMHLPEQNGITRSEIVMEPEDSAWSEEIFHALIENLEDITYLSDPYTYELLYVSPQVRDILGLSGNDPIGKKCYEVLQGEHKPCPFCTNHLLDQKPVIWEHHHRLLNRDYLLKDKFITWNHRKVRMELAIDITDLKLNGIQQRFSIALTEYASLLESLSGTKEILQGTAQTLGKFYQADDVCLIHPTHTGNSYHFKCLWHYENSISQSALVQLTQIEKYAFIQDLFYTNDIIHIPDIEMLRPNYPEEMLLLERYEIRQMLGFSFSAEHPKNACLILSNPHTCGNELHFLRLVCHLLTNRLHSIDAEKKLDYNFWHDALTGLYNLASFSSYTKKRHFEELSSVGLVLADINGFKQINNTMGYSFGNQVLLDTARVFREYFPDAYHFRLSGNEFCIICENASGKYFYQQISLLQADPIVLRHDGISFGYHWMQKEVDFSILKSLAEDSMMEEKQKYYMETPYFAKRHRPTILQQTLRDLKEERFLIYLQPKVDLSSRKLIGAEALIRYRHEERGLIAPDFFIPPLEKEHLIRYIDLFVLEQACRLLRRWQQEGRKTFPISINFSRITLMEEEILPSLLELVHTYQISPSLIQIEITETIEEKDRDVLLTLSYQLRQAGFTIALDDFGTKYTNLSILTYMDFDVLKLDRSLIQTLCFRASNQTIIKHVIQMCKELPVEVIAEGIENEEQAALLTSMGCPSAQGYLFGAPMPISEFESRFMPAETDFKTSP